MLPHDLPKYLLLAPWQGTGGIHDALFDEPLVNGFVDFHHLVIRVAMGIHSSNGRSPSSMRRSASSMPATDKTFGVRDADTRDDPISDQA